ncbi:MAG: AraC family transcriptional regulator [Flavobacteriales bacterium]|nr:AraC family transcriptional regulator [Flavobacteriales bacterium]
MVCLRCKIIVRQELEKLGIHLIAVGLGEVEIDQPLSEKEEAAFGIAIRGFGFDLLEDKRSQLIEKIKNAIVEVVHYSSEPLKYKLSAYLAEKSGYNYNYLSNLFSQVEGVTIEQYFLVQRIEKAKELMVYDNYTLEEIADMLGFSGASHMGKQFKQLTGVTPTGFKNEREKKRVAIEDL